MMKRFRIHSYFALAILIFTGLLFSAAPVFSSDHTTAPNNMSITVSDTNFVTGENVFLRDISTITANGFLKEAIGSIDLGRSPKPGKIVLFDKKKIVSAIKSQRYLPADIIIIAPDRIYIKRKIQSVSEQDVKVIVNKSLSVQLQDQDYRIKSFNVRGLQPYPYGKLDLQFASDTLIGNNGKLSGYVDVIIDGDKKDRLSISGSIEIYKKVLYARELLKKGTTPDLQNVSYQTKNIFDLDPDHLISFDQLEGKILKSDVRAGQYFTEKMLVDPPLIRKGERISLIAGNESMMIITTGISKEDGFENQLIKVENLSSGRLIHGVVKEKSKVEVVY